ncbi:MAG: AarF/UbiB family protein [Pseudomonadota bacterium]
MLDFNAIRHVGRFRDIIGILFKYGFDGIIEKLDIPGHLLVKKITRIEEGVSVWARIRLTIEELGPTFVKFGQIMSMRPDLVPKGLLDELKFLQEDVKPEPFHKIREVVETALKKPLEEIFDNFEPDPVAAASLAQVHRATLKDIGECVAVKVQRPNIEKTIKADLYLLELIAHLIHERLETMRLYNLPGIAAEVRKHILKELDFLHEAGNMYIFRLNFEGRNDVFVPTIYPGYTAKTILTMEFVEGVHIDEVDLIKGDRQAIAQRGIEITLKQILVDGFFHADPHAGNIRLLPGGIICLLDWGMVGRLTKEMRYIILDFIAAIVEKDSEKLVQTTLAMALSVPPLLDETGLQNEAMDIIDVLHLQAFLPVNVGRLFLDFIFLLRQYNVELRPDYVFMLKSIMAIEGVGQQLYPKFNVLEQAQPFIKRLVLERLNPITAVKHAASTLSKTSKLLGGLPERLGKILRNIEGGKLSLQIRHHGLEQINTTLYVAGNRITFGLIMAAIIVGSSMLVTAGVGPLLFGYPVLGVLGFFVSVIFGLWLIIQMIKGKKL